MPEFKNSITIRSRNDIILDKCDIVVDVGSKYDLNLKQFQVFDEKDEKLKKIKLNIFSRINKETFRKRNINKYIKGEYFIWTNWKTYRWNIKKNIFKNFICSVDTKDNGINEYPSNIEPKYLGNKSFSARIVRLNPEWNFEILMLILYLKILGI